jgi:hypothetical protein
MGSRFEIERPRVGSHYAECGREAGERPAWTVWELASRQERPLSRNTMLTRRPKEIKAELSAIKSEDSWSKFLQTVQNQRQCASLHYSTILMLAGNLLMFIPGNSYVPDIVYCPPSSSSLTCPVLSWAPLVASKHNVIHYSDVGVSRLFLLALAPPLSRHLQPL